MSEISALPLGIVNWLETREELSDIKFLTEYPPIKKAVPLKNTTVAVGIESMNIVDAFTENDEGILEREEFCRTAQIRLKLSIHAPFSSGGSACHDAFTDIMDCLTFESGLNIISSGCDGITSDRDTDAFVLAAWIQVEANLCPAASSALPLPSFFTKDLLCGSHIRNEEIHLSDKQIEFLDSPVLTGTYFGDGSSYKSIDIDSEPKAVIVFRAGMPPERYDSGTGCCIVYCAAAGGTGKTNGIELTSNGFRVFNDSSNSGLGFVTKMNEIGKTYFYIVVR